MDVIGAVQGFLGGQSAAKDYTRPREIVDGEKYYKEALAEQRPYHKVWFTNIAMVAGQQWVEWDDTTGFLRTPNRTQSRVRLTVNLILPIVKTWMAKVLSINASFTGVPADSDEESQAAARVSARLLEAIYYETKFRSLMKRWVSWVANCGHGFLWAEFDPSAGGKFKHDFKNENGEDDSEEIPLGKVDCDVSGPFETLMEPGAPEDFRQHRRIMRLRLMKTSDIKAIWGVDVQPDKFEDETAYWIKVRSLVDAAGRSKVNDSTKLLEGMSLVKEYYERETPDFPNGRHFIYAGNVVIQPTEDLDWWEDDERALPCAMLGDITIPGRSIPMSVVEQMTPVQVAFNRINSAILEDVNRLGKAKVLAPIGSITRRQWTEESGEIVDYTPIGSHGPTVVQGAQANQSHLQLRDSFYSYIRDVGMMHDASLGKLPRRATSGVAIEALTDADANRIGPTGDDIASALERIGALLLRKMQDKYAEERIVEYVGQNRSADVLKFKGANLKGCKAVRVAMTPALTRADKVKIGLELASNNAIPIAQALKVMELGDLNVIFDDKADQVNQAKMENLELAKGIVHSAAEFEDHKAHIDTHTRFLNSPTGAAISPEARALLVAHIREHFTFEGQNALPGQRPSMPPRGAAGNPPAGEPEGDESEGADMGGGFQ